MTDTAQKRKKFIETHFPDGIPQLWCPTLTHFDSERRIDFPRMEMHLHWMLPHIKGFLVPGSTGDGWDLDSAETDAVVRFAVEKSQKHGFSLLLGALRKQSDDVLQTVDRFIAMLSTITGKADHRAAFLEAGVCGITVCPPAGKDLGQQAIESALARVLDREFPVALYQLPQVTENETAPETFGRLIARYPNLILFKDSSGADRIALSDVDPRGVFLVRGAEGDYARWIRAAGGRYDGFLLSTANSFPSQLRTVVDGIQQGKMADALRLSTALSGAVGEVFALVESIPCGNAFTNANKAIDHFMAHGPGAAGKEGPMLRGGVRIPPATITRTGEILEKYHLMPVKGYMA